VSDSEDDEQLCVIRENWKRQFSRGWQSSSGTRPRGGLFP